MTGPRIDALAELDALTIRYLELAPAVRSADEAHDRLIRRSALDIVDEGPVAPGKKVSTTDSLWAAEIRGMLASEWPDLVETCLACGVVLPRQRPA